MSDFRTVLIEDSRIADITATEAFGVQSGPAQTTYQQFQAVSSSNSSIVFNVQIPSENIVIDRHVLMRSQLAFQINITPPNPLAAGTLVFDYGVTDSLQAFPLNSLFTTVQSTINNVSISTNLKDVLPMISRMYDRRVLSRINSTTPSYVDNIYGNYQDSLVVAPTNALTGIPANNSPLAGVKNNGYDEDFFPRGAFELDAIRIDHWTGAAWNALPTAAGNAGEYWIISIKATVTEPFLALSPYLNTEPDNEAGLLGVNNLSLVCNVDSTCSRLFSTASGAAPGATGFSPYITSISLGWNTGGNPALPFTTQQVGFANTSLLFNFLSLQPEQYSKISTKNVVPFVDVPRYLTTFTNAATIAGYTPAFDANSGALNDLPYDLVTSQSIQLNQVPDLILICARVPMNAQNWAYPSGFLTIKNISINFNNASGLLSTATQQNLYEMSVRNGSSQSWNEFRGIVSSTPTATAAAPTGKPIAIPSTGSLLVLNPVMDFSLPSYLSSSSLGQYQFQFNVNVANQLPFSVQPEICVITMNSGIFVTQQGTSQIFTGILTKEQVLNTKEKNPVPHLATNEYKRLIGGKLSNRGMGSLMKMVRDMPKLHHHLMAKVEGAGSSGGGSTGGMSGGSISGKGKGSKSLSKLAKHFA